MTTNLHNRDGRGVAGSVRRTREVRAVARIWGGGGGASKKRTRVSGSLSSYIRDFRRRVASDDASPVVLLSCTYKSESHFDFVGIRHRAGGGHSLTSNSKEQQS